MTTSNQIEQLTNEATTAAVACVEDVAYDNNYGATAKDRKAMKAAAAAACWTKHLEAIYAERDNGKHQTRIQESIDRLAWNRAAKTAAAAVKEWKLYR
tara:strand:+ start:1904 stop:2197 length:294 start_codon:yes stop_codon:yes gene_type:complete